MKFYGIPDKYIRILKEMYNGTKCCIRLEQGITNTFEVETGVRQGCILSPFLFTLIIDYILRKQDETGYGIEISKSHIYDLDFADDIVLLDTSNESLQKNTNELKAIAEKIGLCFNSSKCEAMVTLDNSIDISIDQCQVKTTTTFPYLGSRISNTGRSMDEINTRIGKAGAAFGKLQQTLGQKNLNLKTKLNLYNSLVLSILLYGSETWTIYATEMSRLNAFHQRCLRKIIGVTYKDRIKNVEVLHRTGQRRISDVIRERRMRWLGHVLRMKDNRVPKRVLEWTPKGKRKRGRPNLSWGETIQRDLKVIDINISEAKDVAQNRSEWRAVTALCVSNTGRTKV